MGYVIHCLEALHECGNGLERSPQHNILSVGHSALYAASPVGAAGVLSVFIEDLVMDLAAGKSRRRESCAYLHTLYSLHAHERAAKDCVQFGVILHAAAKAGLEPGHNHLHDTACGVSLCLKTVYAGHCLFTLCLVRHPNGIVLRCIHLIRSVLPGILYAADRADISGHPYAESGQELAGNAACSHTDGRLTRAGAL